ncbi:single-stranded DNA-binding protein [Flexivirga endophytica]|uniref:Single-stranded DNA-binding protein n=1 Tax=Flexivirga endophytica TaxID=1849103 RepID=A0A916SU65_9MICO|nr:single-stranded DNA-binding protein [Flexivirga endophytica]GGB16468.1 single-stranded DNA-binding protein [Flexivirga endophytica]GHB39083.1 single-stranded DNA-binding protein [Flexivirga endophytica]
MNETHVTIRGNLVAEPDRISSAKGDFSTFRVAVNEFYRDQVGGGYVDGRSSFYKVVAFRAVGSNVQQSLKKGMPVLVHGILRMSQWQTSNGETRSAPEIEAINVGPDLRYGIATYQKVPGQNQRGGGSEQPSWRRDGNPTTDPWGNASAEAAPESAVADLTGDAAEEEPMPSSGPLVEQQAS